MRACGWVILAALAGWPGAARAVEIATGKMLGAGYDARAFYVRAGKGAWSKTYTGARFRPEAAGRLMNLRLAQALFEDEWLNEFTFDARKNTEAVIAALDEYKAAGVLAINVSLQGGNPGYGREVAEIKRVNAAKEGKGKGLLVSAFRADGSLKQGWTQRLLRLARELDRRGMILNLMYFYQGQDEVLANGEAIRAAVRNATDFLIDHNLRNVIIEIANEVGVQGFDHDLYIEKNLAELIRLARGRFAEKKAGYVLPVSASSIPRQPLLEGVAEAGDVVLFHGNGRTPDWKRKTTAELVGNARAPGPVVMNEDDNGRETTAENLQKELESCGAVWAEGGSWGYMPWRQTQMFPFRLFRPAGPERDASYFRSVLEHLRKLVYR